MSKFGIDSMRRLYAYYSFKTLMQILLLIFLYKVTVHQYISSYTYANLKLLTYERSKFHNVDKREKLCLLSNPFQNEDRKSTELCSGCESTTEILQIYDTSFDEIETISIHQNRPVLVIDVMFDWPNFSRTMKYDLSDIVATLKLSRERITQPCYISSNLMASSNFVTSYLKLISNPTTDHWFFVWKNCDLKAAKSIRLFYKQPYFTKYFLPAPQINWVILSSNYQSTSHKKLETEFNKLLILMQLKGTLDYRLQPREHCDRTCSAIEDVLKESQTLVFSSNSWELFYKLQDTKINISIMVQHDL